MTMNYISLRKGITMYTVKRYPMNVYEYHIKYTNVVDYTLYPKNIHVIHSVHCCM